MDDARARVVLGVSADASLATVRDAYRRLLHLHHPDVAGPSGGATARTAELNLAYAIIAHPPAPPPPPEPASADAHRRPMPRVTFDIADDADGVLAVEADTLDVFNQLCEAADAIGSLSYVDRANTILETIITPPVGPTCSLMVTLQSGDDETLAYCTLESLDARPGPPIQEVVDALRRELERLART